MFGRASGSGTVFAIGVCAAAVCATASGETGVLARSFASGPLLEEELAEAGSAAWLPSFVSFCWFLRSSACGNSFAIFFDGLALGNGIAWPLAAGSRLFGMRI